MRPVGVSRDFLNAHGENVWGDIGLDALGEYGIEWEYLPEDVDVLRPADIEARAGVLFAAPAVTAETFVGVQTVPRVLARFGVGYDAVNLAACTAAGAAVTITPDGAQRPVATAALAMLLGGMLNLAPKDRIVRSGDWSTRTAWMGRGLTGATIGIMGFGSTGTELARLLAPFGVTVLAFDPYVSAEKAASHDARLVTREELARESDAVVIMAVLSPETYHSVDAAFLGMMRPTATLVNVARGPIVDEAALVEALRSGTIRNAALDVFEDEPLAADSPLLALENTLLAPHCVAWTDEMSRGNGASAVQAIIDGVQGRVPKFVVNRDVLQTDAWAGAR